MGPGRRSQSLRGSRSYGKLQEPCGRCSGGRLRRSLSLRERGEKHRPSDASPDTPAPERLPGALGDTEQLIEAQHRGGRRWLKSCQQERGGAPWGPGAPGVCSASAAGSSTATRLSVELHPQRGAPAPLVCPQVKRRWESFVASFPGVTLSRPASPEPPLGATS